MIYLFSPPRQIVSDEATEFTSAIVQAILTMLSCRLKVISPYNHGSSTCERQIKTISEIIVKHLWDKGQMWPLFATTAQRYYNLQSNLSQLLAFAIHPQSTKSKSDAYNFMERFQTCIHKQLLDKQIMVDTRSQVC